MAEIQISSAAVRSSLGISPHGDEFEYPPMLEVKYPSPLYGAATPHTHIVPLEAVADVQNTFGYETAEEAAHHVILVNYNDHQDQADVRQKQDHKAMMTKQREMSKTLMAHWADMQATFLKEAEEADLDDGLDETVMIDEIAELAEPTVVVEVPVVAKGLTGAAKAAAERLAAKAVRRGAVADKVKAKRQAIRAAVGATAKGNHSIKANAGRDQLKALLDAHADKMPELRRQNFEARYGDQVKRTVMARVHQEKTRMAAMAQQALVAQAAVLDALVYGEGAVPEGVPFEPPMAVEEIPDDAMGAWL